jgi:tetratricopeptide (TPR) repeat protein
LFALAQAATELKQNGDARALRAAVRKIPGKFDPGGAVTTIALRLSLIERDYDEAERVLSVSSRHEYNDQGIGGTAACLDGYGFPKGWYEGLIARGRGQADLAQEMFESARKETEGCIRRSPEDAKASVMLGLIDAKLGRKEEALREGRRAVELLPIAKDAYDGPIIATNLAVIYAQVGEPDLAIEQLAPLMEIPNGPTRGLLRIEPEWDALRDDARFKKLVAG